MQQNINRLRPYTFAELADQYGISTKVLRSWLSADKKAIGKKVGKCYTIVQVNIIYNLLGQP